MRRKRFNLLLLQIFILLFIIALFIFVNSKYVNLTPKCLWKEKFGIICPGCGATRCIVSLLHGDLISSFMFNPFLFILIIYLIILDIVYSINTFFEADILKILYPKWWYIVIYVILWVGYTVILNII